MTESMNTDGIQLVGDVSSRTVREALVEQDYTNAWKAGAHWALDEVAKISRSMRSVADPYDDMRALVVLETWITDKIREVHSKATNGNDR